MTSTELLHLAWRESSYSGMSGNCVEVGFTWRKPSYSGGNGTECVEIGNAPGVVGVRDTKDRDGATLAFGPQQWRAFVTGVRSDVFAG